MVRSVNDARSYLEQRTAESQADARQIIDVGERERSAKISGAKGSADRFTKLAQQIQHDATVGGRDYALSRNLTLKRLYVETLREILSRAKSKVVLDAPQPADLMMQRE